MTDLEGRSAPVPPAGDEDIAGLRGFEVSGTPTTGVMIFCIRCEHWFAEWTSRQPYPRLAEMVQAAESLAQQIVSFIRHHVPHHALEPWQVYAVEHWCERPDYLAHFEIHADGRVVDNMELLRSRGNGNANL